jgi:hypothetical protein
MKIVTLLSAAFLYSQAPLFSNSAFIINVEDHPRSHISMNAYVSDQLTSVQSIRQLQKEEKKLVKVESRLNKFFQKVNDHQERFGLFSDPVNKWLWFWIFGWSLGLLITLISGATVTTGFLGILWLVGFVGGSIALVIWLLKKFGN